VKTAVPIQITTAAFFCTASVSLRNNIGVIVKFRETGSFRRNLHGLRLHRVRSAPCSPETPQQKADDELREKFSKESPKKIPEADTKTSVDA
jgi:hypothetical protein